jgi:hypothetical protein
LCVSDSERSSRSYRVAIKVDREVCERVKGSNEVGNEVSVVELLVDG